MNESANNLATAVAARRLFGVARSGSPIEIVGDSGSLMVRKWSSSPSTEDALRRQQKKQCEFYARQDSYDGVRTASLSSKGDAGGAYFDMEYVPFLPVSEQIATWSPRAVSRFLDRLSGFIEQNIEEREHSLSTAPIAAKLDEIVERTRHIDALSRHAVSIVEKRKEAIPSSVAAPRGYEHGDLTFSNILASASGEELVLIDFTLSPVVTPLQDIAKLLQDLVFRWSWRRKSMNNREIARLDANLKHIKSRVCDAYEAAYPESLSLLTFLTIARILPYAQSSGDVAWIVDALQNLENKITE